MESSFTETRSRGQLKKEKADRIHKNNELENLSNLADNVQTGSHGIQSKNEAVNNEGWNNLIRLIAFMGVFRFILVNFVELGWLVEIPGYNLTSKELFYTFLIIILKIVRYVFFYLISDLKLFSVIFIASSEVFLAVLNYRNVKNPIVSAYLFCYSIVSIMKMTSYLLTPKTKNFAKYCEFLLFPTLIFKDSYARKTSRNSITIIKCTVKIFICFLLLCFFMDQLAVPALINIIMLKSLNRVIDGLFNLSLASIILFNLSFKITFDYAISIVCELTLFDEKEAYGKWWNAKTSEEFWSKWNLQTHYFVKKYIYLPLLNSGINRYASSLICFIFSGAIHEYVVSMSLKSFNGWFLVGMIAQVPLHFITNYVKKRFPSAANTFFWLSFCVIGQPIFTILIYRAFHMKNNTFSANNSKFFEKISKLHSKY